MRMVVRNSLLELPWNTTLDSASEILIDGLGSIGVTQFQLPVVFDLAG